MTQNNMPKILIRVLIVLLTCVVSTGCNKEKPVNNAVTRVKIDPLALEAELDILALSGRIESGENNPNYDWVTPFEAATGCEVKAIFVDNNEALVSMVSQQKFDLVIATELQWPPDLVQPINTSRLRSITQLDPRFSKSPLLKFNTGIPFQWQLIQPVPPSTETISVIESTHLLAKAKNTNCAYAWMEWSLSPKVQGDIAAALGTIPVVPAACIGNELLGDNACKLAMEVTPAKQLDPKL